MFKSRTKWDQLKGKNIIKECAYNERSFGYVFLRKKYTWHWNALTWIRSEEKKFRNSHKILIKERQDSPLRLQRKSIFYFKGLNHMNFVNFHPFEIFPTFPRKNFLWSLEWNMCVTDLLHSLFSGAKKEFTTKLISFMKKEINSLLNWIKRIKINEIELQPYDMRCRDV